jgi:hypothetical protein
MPAPGSGYTSITIAATLAVSLIAAILAGVAFAGPLEDATAANLSGDYATALRLLRPLADEGNATAQNSLGAMYAFGRGVPLDHAEAAKWYRKAADQGNAAAQYNLGVSYANGLGVPQDYAAAMQWYRKAADQGDADAQKLVRDWKPIAQPLSAAAPAIPASTGISRSAAIDVGRVTLRISDDGWENIGASRGARPFTGDQSGGIQYETQHLLLRGKAGEFRAALTVGASRGVGGLRFSFTTSCQPETNLYAVDNTGSDFRGRDCLRVSSLIRTQGLLESAAPDLLAELTARNVVLPNGAYLVIYEKAIDNGTFTRVQAVFAADFNLPTEAGSAVNLPAGVKPEAVAWGLRLAEAVRSSIYSPSGTLLLPPVTAKVN